MAKNFNKYQYETSPRKLVPDYTTPKRNKPKKKKSTARKQTAKENKNIKKKEVELKAMKRKVLVYLMLGFTILFGICYRNAQIDESFEELQDLKAELKDVEKQNSQLEIAIENSVNFSTIEQQAKEQLGMQKLNSKQTVYVDLQKDDYIAPMAEDVIIDDGNFLDKILETIKSLFK